MPEAAKERSFEGAKAFTRYYFRVLSQALNSGRYERVAALSSARCTTCKNYGKAVRDVYRDGGELQHGGMVIKRLAAAPGYQATRPIFLLKVHEKSAKQFNSSGKVIRRTSRSETAQRTSLEWSEGWVMLQIQVVE